MDKPCTVHGKLALMFQRTSIESKEHTITVPAIIMKNSLYTIEEQLITTQLKNS